MFDEFSIDKFFCEGDIIVDVGSWDNIIPSLSLSKIGCSVIPIDKYQRMEEFKKILLRATESEEVKEEAENIHPIKADVNFLPFCNKSVDGVIFYYSSSWVEQFGSDLLVVYKEVSRVLKEKGIAMLFESTVMRAKEQELFLKTQLKTNRIGTIVLGKKIRED
jgi:ubiquinone/menaquinone biosynthesis C-methylase UbiE